MTPRAPLPAAEAWALALANAVLAGGALGACNDVDAPPEPPPAAAQPQHHPELASEPVTPPPRTEKRTEDPRVRAHAVLSTAGRHFVLQERLDEHAPSASDEHLLMTGGMLLDVSPLGPASGAYTVVGAGVHCTTHATRRVALTLDDGEPEGGGRGPTRAALELGGCDPLEHGVSIALEGERGARWVELKQETSLELPSTPLKVSVRAGQPSGSGCSDEPLEVVVHTAQGDVSSHRGFEPLGSVDLGDSALLVLTGTDQPDALRVLQLDQRQVSVRLDTTLDLFQDTGIVGC